MIATKSGRATEPTKHTATEDTGLGGLGVLRGFGLRVLCGHRVLVFVLAPERA
jgi:hypothetical protein